MKSALLVGASGFIGRTLGEALRERGTEVHGVDRSVRDVREPLDAELPEVDVVFHLAQSPHYRDFPERSRDLFQTNLFSLNEYCRAAIDRARLVVFFSSGSVFGRPSRIVTPETPPTAEGFYAWTKWAGEQCLAQYAAHYATLVVRPFSPYGPGQVDKLLPNLATRIVDGQPVRVTPGLRMSFIHVRDLVDLVVAASDRCIREEDHRTFNVASDEVVTLEETATLLFRSLDREPAIEIGDPVPDAVVAADCRDLYEYAGFKPRIGLEEGIAEFSRAFLAGRA